MTQINLDYGESGLPLSEHFKQVENRLRMNNELYNSFKISSILMLIKYKSAATKFDKIQFHTTSSAPLRSTSKIQVHLNSISIKQANMEEIIQKRLNTKKNLIDRIKKEFSEIF